MKQILSLRASLSTLTLCLIICCGNASAQTYVPATLSDHFWYSPCYGGSGYIAGLNTAMIDFSAGPNSFGTLMVSDYYGNGTEGGLVCTDLATGYTVSYPYCTTPFYITQQPDIIVGNDAQNPLTDFRVAVVYPGPPLGAPQIDFFLVHYIAGYTSFTITYLSSLSIPVTSSFVVHIDIIAEAGNTSITGLPWCDKFVVTCDRPGGSINAFYGSLNAPGSFLQIMTPLTAVGVEPDVAAIQRLSCAACSPPPANLALITYTDNTYLYYFEWDVSGTSPGSVTTLGSAYSSLYMPRIDAPDDYTINYPSIYYSYYKIVAQQNGADVLTFDNMGVYDMYYNLGVPGGNLLPSVAFGGNGNTQYQVAQYNIKSLYEAYMEPIDWSVPGFLAAPNDYFQVNYSPIGYIAFGGNYDLTSVSTPCNNPSHLTLVAWTYSNTLTWLSNVYYKVTPYAYAFRNSHQGGAPAPSSAPQIWQVFPNPATTSLTVTTPGGAYDITDMLGRTVLQGNLTAGEQSVDLSSLTSGSYIFTGYKGDSRDYNSVFVKQ